jgi:uncharacterized HAD superfamily protein
MNIGIDIDDVLAEFQVVFLPFFNKKHGTHYKKEDIYTYSYPMVFSMTFEEVVQDVYEFYMTKEFEEILPAKGSQKTLKLLNVEHKLYAITSRPHFMTEKTERWIDKHYHDLFTDILLTNQFTHNHEKKISKSVVCKKNGIQVLIDDAPANAEDVSSEKIWALLLEKPWNRTAKLNARTIRVKNWYDIPKAIDQISKEPRA